MERDIFSCRKNVSFLPIFQYVIISLGNLNTSHPPKGGGCKTRRPRKRELERKKMENTKKGLFKRIKNSIGRKISNLKMVISVQKGALIRVLDSFLVKAIVGLSLIAFAVIDGLCVGLILIPFILGILVILSGIWILILDYKVIVLRSAKVQENKNKSNAKKEKEKSIKLSIASQNSENAARRISEKYNDKK